MTEPHGDEAWPFMPDETIVCVDCGGPARLLSTWDDENPPRPGDLAVYRCVECLDRWDLIIPGPDGDLDPTDEG
jgi:hypothetical protein